MLVNDDNFGSVASQCLRLASPTFIGMDTETTGLLPYYGDKLVGVSLYMPQWGQGYYFPVAHATDTLWGSVLNLSGEYWQKLLELIEALGQGGHTFLMWNAPFDVAMLVNAGMTGWPGNVIDVQVAAQLVDETVKLSLAERGVQDMGLSQLHDAELAIERLGGKGKIAAMGPVDVAEYAVLDAWAPCALWSHYGPLLQDTDDGRLWEVMGIEHRITPLLWRAWQRGIACDLDLLQAGEDACTERMNILEAQIRHSLGSPNLNVGNPKQLQELLGLTTTAKAALKKCDHPVAPLILEWRAYQKLRGTSFRASVGFSSRAQDGRLHPCLNQTGARTGRFSCKDPNLQGTPRSADQVQDVPLVRNCIVADPGRVLLFADYAQAELRLIAHYTESGLMYESMACGDDVHAQTARVLFGDGATKAQRQTGKTMNFAMQYGAGYKEIAEQLSISEREAKELRSRYHQAYPEIRRFSETARERASWRGYIYMWTGRRSHYPDRSWGHTRSAVSYLIQGGVAEMVKRAMLRIDEALRERGWGEVVFQMHDEVICSVAEQHADEAAVLIKQLGEDFPFDPPPILEVSVGRTWAHKARIA